MSKLEKYNVAYSAHPPKKYTARYTTDTPKNTTQKKEKHMKTTKSVKKETNTRDWKKLRETAKSVALIVIITGAIAFYAGMRYQAGQDAHTNQKVSEAVKELSLKQSKDNQ